MKTFVCSKCGHIEFEKLPGTCFVCGVGAGEFTEKADAINKPADPDNLTEAERKHIPKIVVVRDCGLIPDGTCLDVHVKIGEIEHVMQSDHYIKYIDYYLDYKFISRVSLSAEACHPAAALHLNANKGTITAIENCNKHGNWQNQADL